MKIRVQLEGEEYVEDWMEFRIAFERAAESVGLKITTIIHTDGEHT